MNQFLPTKPYLERYVEYEHLVEVMLTSWMH